MPLQVSPQAFSSMHAWHMVKPQGHDQRKEAVALQQGQATLRFFRERAPVVRLNLPGALDFSLMNGGFYQIRDAKNTSHRVRQIRIYFSLD